MDERLILRSGGSLAAAWSLLPDRAVRDAVLRSRFDAVLFDMQHGMHDLRSIEEALIDMARAGKPSIVRVPLNGLGSVSRVLDLGASAVVLPMIESPADARALVAVAKYPPLGERSFGPGRAQILRGFETSAAYMASSNDTTMALAMIETRNAFSDLDSILAVQGLDGVFVGPADLSIALTGSLDTSCEPVVEAARVIARKAKERGKFAAIYTGDAREAERARGFGYDLIGFSSDTAMLDRAAAAMAQDAKG